MKQKKFLALILFIGSLNGLLASEKLPPVHKKTKQKFTTYNPQLEEAAHSQSIEIKPSTPIHPLSFSPSIGLSGIVSTSPKSYLPATKDELSKEQISSLTTTTEVFTKSNSKKPRFSADHDEEISSLSLDHLEDLILKFKSFETQSNLNLESIKEIISLIDEYKINLKKATLKEDLYSTENDDLLDKHRAKLNALLNEQKITLGNYEYDMNQELREEDKRHEQMITAISFKFKKMAADSSERCTSEAERLKSKIETIELEQEKLNETREKIQKLLYEQEKTKKFLIHDTNTQLKKLDEELKKLEEQISINFTSDDSNGKKELYQSLMDTNKSKLKFLQEQLNSLILILEKAVPETNSTTSEISTTDYPTLQQASITATTDGRSYWVLKGLF